jgi:hypothetical protein
MKVLVGSRLLRLALALSLAAPALGAQKANVVSDVKGATDVKGAVAPDQSKMWAAQTSPNEIRLSWAHVTGAVSYTIGCAMGAEPPRVMGTVGAPGGIIHAVAGVVQRLQYVVVTRAQGAYDCWVRATDPKGAVSSPIHFNKVSTLEKAALTRLAPERVTATETGPEEVTVTWTEVPGATAYFIGRAVSPGGFKSLCDLCPTTTTYVDRAVTRGARHTYTVGALTPKGAFPRATSNAVTLGESVATGGPAPTDSVTPPAAAAGAAPSDVKAAFDDDSKSAARVRWRPVDGANAYRVMREVDGVVTVLAQFTPAGIVVRNGMRVIEFVDHLADIMRANSKRRVVVRYRVVAIFPTTDPAKSLSEPASSNDLVIDPKAANDGPKSANPKSGTS